MDSRSTIDRISRLSDFLLVLIISNLPFKEALRTSVLSRRWKNINRETRNISFNEFEITQTYADTDDDHTKRAEFVRYMVDWVSNFSGGIIETFELSFPKPVGFETEMETVIDFAARKKVKHLVLDLSDPLWINRAAVEAEEEINMIPLPESVYKLTNLVTLKLLACWFYPARLANAGSLESLYFGWMQLETIMSLLSKTPLLETLHLKNCWKVGLGAITGFNNRLIKLVFKNCAFVVQCSTLDLPNILIFKYSGKVHHFEFKNVNRRLEDVYLDYGQETEYHDGLGNQLCHFLYELLCTKTLTICPFLLQVIRDCANPLRLKAEMEVRRLVLKTNLEPNEFIGIRFMINSCPYLETLTFQLVVTTPVEMVAPHFEPEIYWMAKISHTCLKKTLKNIEMWNFCGGLYELYVLKYLIRYGRCLERVDLYLPSGVGEAHLLRLRAAAEMVGTTFKASSKRLMIYLHE